MNLTPPAEPAQKDWLPEDAPASLAADTATPPIDVRTWRVLIVDDDADVHSATRLALRGVCYKDRAIELLSAYSAGEAFAALRDEPDIALVLLDVVMETDDAGLRLIQRIRQELANPLVRIVLRTGQPGQAPEQSVVIDYDINDYKAKTELTVQKLFTTVISSLRAYESLVMIERSRVGMGKILEGTTNLYKVRSLREFASGILNQISALLDVGADGLLCVLQCSAIEEVPTPIVVAATGHYANLLENEKLPLGHPLLEVIARAFKEQSSLYQHPNNVLLVQTQQGHKFVILVSPPVPLTDVQRNLLDVYCHRIASAFDNLYLFGQVHKAQEATVVALADMAEYRDECTGGHVRRVQLLTQAIANKLHERAVYAEQLTPQILEMIGIASILHDVGKVATPDHILLKPGRFTPTEWAIMQLHAPVGEAILERAAKMVDGSSYLTYGAQIAGGHHEHFDGSGYPRALKGQEIPLVARIVAVVDVCDALLTRRPYKEPWPMDQVLSYIRERRGTQFDPHVVDAFLEIIAANPANYQVIPG